MIPWRVSYLFSNSFLKKFTRYYSKDVTGNFINTKNKAYVQDLDFSIMTMISGVDNQFGDATEAVRNVIKLDKDCGIGYSLLAFEHIRNRSLSHSNEELSYCLDTLETLAIQDKLTEREKYFAAAALCCADGNHLKAAALLESSIMKTENDILAVRLAQDCYLAVGDSKNALGCVTRCSQAFSDIHYLYGHYQGILAVGFLETGRFVDSEEVSDKAISFTRGRDVHALNALMSTYQLTGRSSEVVTSLDQYQHLFEGTAAQHLLYFHKGLAMVQRGNCSGARSVLRQWVDELQPASRRLTSSVSLASLLLWQLSINMTQEQMLATEDLCTFVASLWTPFVLAQASSENEGLHSTPAWQQVCATVSLALAVAVRDRVANPTVPAALGSGEQPSLTQGGGWNSWITSGFNANQSKQVKLSAHTQDFVDPREVLHMHRNNLRKLCSVSEPSSPSSWNQSSSDRFPLLTSVLPAFKLTIYHNKHNKTSADYEDQQNVIYISDAVEHFVGNRLKEAADCFLASRERFANLGGGVLMKDSLEQTLVESFLRSNQLQEARMLLSERTAIAPNEAQSWRRMAIVLEGLGQRDAAEKAQYTAWQLGIGQGGFGGPI